MKLRQTSFIPGTKARPTDNFSNRGQDFEAALIDMGKIYSAMGRGWVMKQYPRSVIVSHDNRGSLAKITGNATVDFLACLNGRFIAFDAKDCEGKRIPLSRLADHQLQDLIDVARNGGIAFVLVRFERKRLWRIPALAWASATYQTGDSVDGWTPSGAASISEDELPRAWAVDGYDYLKGGI